MQRSKFRQLLSYLRPHWQQVALGTLTLLIVNGLGVYIPWLIRNGIDDLEVAFTMERVWRYVLWIGVLATVMWGIRVVSRMLLFGIGRQVEFDLKQRIFQHLLYMDADYFSRNRVGDLINRATSDVDNLRRLLGFAVLSILNTIFAYLLTLPVMLSISPRLTLLSMVIYPVMFILVWVFSGRLRDEQRDVQEKLSSLSELIQEDMSGISLVKIYGQEENERRAFAHYNEKLFESNLALARTRSTLFPLLQGLAGASLLILLGFGAGEIADGAIAVGDFVAMILYVERLVFPTALLGFTLTVYQRGEVSIDRIEAIFTSQSEIRDRPSAIALPPQDVLGRLEARNLHYVYPGDNSPALDQMCFTIEPGETIAVVGSIGSGKSTLANAIPRILEIEPGQLFLDGYDITQLRLEDLRGAIAYVPQDSFLFSSNIRDNIRYGNPQADQIDVEHAAKLAQIHPEILNFPKQYDTIVGERGITLSGGQRQRTALARALLMDAPVLILDDALSSVDNQTASQILQELSTGTERKTVLFISHQLSAAAKADRILVLDRGAVSQLGTHAELIQQPGLYQSLWEEQQLEALLR
ncbi:ABC transporter ATP-binding protein/permease [Phormidium yuhuli AB48]|uniref:ABC transporter ATP-binding protein/permease n=1 Tax=Phormidium yuhuli AB48 TaxID=2940671 RepID=A0ABY5AUM1_9CYAN|nr:ABC transporter ATP-binding protein [Phormidium yuhuli]USR92735.1 ABC transporter ATP-binding protein/permease [Phormidium yuhuli AB48]